MARVTKKDRAYELLRLACRGPAFETENVEAFEAYRRWSTSWLLPAMKMAIPELRDVVLPPIGTTKPDASWENRTFAGNRHDPDNGLAGVIGEGKQQSGG